MIQGVLQMLCDVSCYFQEELPSACHLLQGTRFHALQLSEEQCSPLVDVPMATST